MEGEAINVGERSITGKGSRQPREDDAKVLRYVCVLMEMMPQEGTVG